MKVTKTKISKYLKEAERKQQTTAKTSEVLRGRMN
jgi:hypothetical protein